MVGTDSLSALISDIKKSILDDLRDEAIIKLDQDVLSPVISKHQLAKELCKSDKWVKDNIFENPRYSTDIQSMLDEGLIQMTAYGEKTRVIVNRKAIKKFLDEHSAELPWLEGVWKMVVSVGHFIFYLISVVVAGLIGHSIKGGEK